LRTEWYARRFSSSTPPPNKGEVIYRYNPAKMPPLSNVCCAIYVYVIGSNYAQFCNLQFSSFAQPNSFYNFDPWE
jgi:hypothetical protein